MPPNDPEHASAGDVFRSALSGVTPLKPSGRVDHHRPLPKPRPLKHLSANDSDAFADGLSDAVESDDAPAFQRPGVPRLTLRDLRRGRWPAHAELDLHGATRDEARQQLCALIQHARQHGGRVIRVIHGRGIGSHGQRSVLRPLVRGWLQQHPDILAYSQAKPQDGGEGALWVLIRGK